MNTEIINIVDRSLSMTRIDRGASEGFNAFIAAQLELPGECRVSTYRFDNRVECDYSAIPIQQVPKMLSVGPRGNTALRDAICNVLNNEGMRIRSEGWAQKVIVNILTDGEENASRQYSQRDVHNTISAYREQGWDFIFVAANIDTERYAADYGIDAAYTRSFNYSGAGATAAYGDVSAMTTQLRGTTWF